MFWVYSIYGQQNMTGTHLHHEEFSRFSLGGTIYYFLPILILSVCDPIAALCGKKWSLGRYSVWGNRKTIVGSTAFFVSAFLLSAFFVIPNTINVNCGLMVCAVVAAVSTLLEAISDKGYDNLFIPLSVAAVLVIFNQYLVL
jgi:dolichol kinase